MSANLFGERFFSLREPAWHSLGLVVPEPMSSVEAFSALGPYDVELRDLYYGSQGDEEGVLDLIEIPNRAIVRTPVPDDPTEKFFGLVGPEYVLVTPQDVFEIYDQVVNAPVETIGALGSGETLFLTTKLPDIDLKGDLVENYLLVVSPYTGAHAMQVRVTPIRVVCQNTLVAAKAASSEVYRIIHDTTVKERLGEWMGGLHDRAVERVEILQQAFELFAKTKVKDQAPIFLEQVYPNPKPPRENAPEEVMEARMKDFQYAVDFNQRSRDASLALFEGQGTGMKKAPAKGTFWGLYNAVAEWENYRPTSFEEGRPASILFGERGKPMERAYSILMDAAQSG